jgi:predicted ATPase
LRIIARSKDQVTLPAWGEDSPLLERAADLAALDESLSQALAGHGSFVLVSGDAGIGKTALVRAFCDARRSNTRVLWGACDPLFTPRPLGPLLNRP